MFRNVRSASRSPVHTRRRLIFECIEARRLLAGDLNPWHNASNPADVTGDGRITAADSLHIANYLERFGPGATPTDSAGPPYYDTTNDGSITAADQQLVEDALAPSTGGVRQNPRNALDVTNDQQVNIHDVRELRSYLDAIHRGLSRSIPDDYFYDVDGDGSVTRNDQALVAAFVSPINTAPVAHRGLYIAEEGTALVAAGSSELNFRDDNSDPLRTILVSRPANGSLLFNEDGSFVYTPDAGFIGQDTFTYQVDDGREENNLSDVATVTIDVRPVRPKPTALPDHYEVMEGRVLVVDGDGILANDTPAIDDELRVADVTRPKHGTIIWKWPNMTPHTGAFTYIPDPGFTGTDTFIYQALEQNYDRNYGEWVNTWSPFTTVTIRVVAEAEARRAALDVTADGKITALDALTVINLVNSGLTTQAEGESAANSYDANLDGAVTAADALAIINHLNAGLGASASAAEGESALSATDTSAADELFLLLALDGEESAISRRQR